MAKVEPVSLDHNHPWTQCNRNTAHVTTPNTRIGQNELDWIAKRDEDGDTYLHIAVAKGNEIACRNLIGLFKSRGLSLDVKNKLMQTPLHLACLIDNPAVVAMLLNASPTSSAVTDRHGNNSIHLAVKHSSLESQHTVLKMLLKSASRQSLEMKNLFGLAPMHIAAIEGNCEAIRLLKKCGADVNILENKGGAPPINLATRASQREAAQALLELGANPNLRTGYGETASQLASAKGDHVISELLALYDSPYESSKHGSVPRYISDTFVSSSSRQNIRYRDVKLHPIHNSRHSHVAMLASPIRQIPLNASNVALTSPARHQAVNIKKEPTSPASLYPSNRKRSSTSSAVTNSNNSEENNQPLNFVTRKRVSHDDDVPATSLATRKRKSDESEPLDLTTKRSKKVENEEMLASSESTRLPEKYVFLQPVYQQHTRMPAGAHQTPATRPHPTANNVPASVIKQLNPSYHGIPRHILFNHQNVKQLSDTHQRLQYSNRKARENHSPEDQRDKIQLEQVESGLMKARKMEQVMPHSTALVERRAVDGKMHRPKTMHVNGMYSTLQPNHKRSVLLRDDFSRPNAAVEQPISSPPRESRDKYQPIIRHFVEVRDLPRANRYEQVRKFSGAGERLYLAPEHRVSPRSRPHGDGFPTIIDVRGSINRDRRYRSDEPCPSGHVQRAMQKQAVLRRNSAPVATKSGGDKMDLRSYTGCLPPHFLHLLESSGNLPVRPSNVLRNVADVLRDDVSTNDVKEETTGKEKEPTNNTAAKHYYVTTSQPSTPPKKDTTKTPIPSTLTTADVTHSAAIQDDVKATVTSVVTSEENEGHASPPRTNHLETLGDWHNIEAGDFPGLGNPPQISSDKIKKCRVRRSVEDKHKINEKYVSESTRKIIARVGMFPAADKRAIVESVPATCMKHTCPGCIQMKKDIPSMIDEIWRYQPYKKYVTSATQPSTTSIYCFQLKSNNTTSTSAPPVTSSDSVVTLATLSDASEVSRLCSSPSVNKQDVSRINGLDKKLEELHQKALIRHKDVADDALSRKKEHEVHDDILENSIEDSSDDETEDEPIKKLQYGVTTSNHVVNNKTTNGYHDNLPGIIKKQYLENMELHSALLRKIRDVQAIASRGSSDIDRENDIEISDDEDGHVNGKVG